MAGFIPGILAGLSLMVATYLVAIKRGYPRETFPGWKLLIILFANALPGLMTAIIIVGGVLSGIFTATESASIAVIYALVVTCFFYRSMNWKNFVTATLGAIRTTAMVLLIIGSAASFAWLLALNEVPDRLFLLLQSVSDNPLIIMLMVNIILLFLGTFMDMSPLIIICTPIFLPVMVQLGMDPVQFGIVLMVNLGIGLVTPPVGTVLFVGCAVGGVKMEDTVRTIWPFYVVMVATLLLVTYIPAISMFIPKLLMG
jgi:tripartite ATP-independent transporter DctM subunit